MESFVWETSIAASADDVFSLLADLRAYDRWLPNSTAYHGTLQISDEPIKVGTTYVEPGPFGTRHGTVTSLIRPGELDFEQPMTMKPRFMGTIGIQLFHRIAVEGETVRLMRRLELSFHGPVRFLKSPIIRAFMKENDRMMKALKAFAEGERRPPSFANPASGA
ncbi:hypothetical protein GR212_22005 [Rhizobium lusitanum]|uniref:SRPBCC family protein n=1 Tax=Rhizobium lusitanum TaxID=293958 RepID=A0A6L9UDC0_9HYPH|nr:hypothetical protein [Rhizobium lusitanum]